MLNLAAAAPLALYLKLDQIVNGTTVKDASNNGRDGTVYGAPRVVPQMELGGCIAFNGSTDYIEVPDPLGAQNSAFTFSLWVQPHVINSGYHGFFGKADGVRNPSLWVGPQNGQLHYDSYDATTSARYYGLLDNFFLATDEWVHVAWVKDGTQYRIYRNGILFATQPAPPQFHTAQNTYHIGMVDNAFNGQLANLRVYSQAVTADIILRDLEADKTSSAVFRKTYPLSFTVTDDNAQPVLAITNNPGGESIHLDITNTSLHSIALLTPTNNNVGADNCHFELRFRPGILTTPNQIALASALQSSWLLSSAQLPDGTVSLYLLSKQALTLAPDQTLSFQLQQVKADGSKGSRGTRVELRYRQITYQDDTTLLTGNRISYLTVVNKTGQENIPLHISVVNPDSILNDGVTKNTVTLHIINMSEEPIVLNADQSAASSFILACDVQPEGKGPNDEDSLAAYARARALTTAENAVKINLAVADTGSNKWSVVKPLLSSVKWELILRAPLTLKQFEFIQIKLTNIITDLPSGQTNFYIHYKNIPGYWDGYLVGSIGKDLLGETASNYQRAQLTMSGGGAVTWKAEADKSTYLKWTDAFIAWSMGSRKSLTLPDPIPEGIIKFSPPTAYIRGGSSYKVDAKGVPLKAGEALYAIHAVGGGSTNIQYTTVAYTEKFYAPGNWLLIALANNDNTVKLGTGLILALSNASTAGSPIPVGTILMWSGQASTIPSGWALCDGRNGTPNLVSRFVVGAGDANAAEQPNTQGDATQHNHTVPITDSFPTSQDGSHTHGIPSPWHDTTALNNATATGKTSINAIDRGPGSVSGIQTGASGDHTHVVSFSLLGMASTVFELRPKWYALCYIIKL